MNNFGSERNILYRLRPNVTNENANFVKNKEKYEFNKGKNQFIKEKEDFDQVKNQFIKEKEDFDQVKNQFIKEKEDFGKKIHMVELQNVDKPIRSKFIIHE
jgi:hypothetical protein